MKLMESNLENILQQKTDCQNELRKVNEHQVVNYK